MFFGDMGKLTGDILDMLIISAEYIFQRQVRRNQSIMGVITFSVRICDMAYAMSFLVVVGSVLSGLGL